MAAVEIALSVLGLACVLAMATFIYAAYRGGSLIVYDSETKRLPWPIAKKMGRGAIRTLAAIGLMVCYGAGVYMMLALIPADTGYRNAEGDYVTFRTLITTLFVLAGGGASILFVQRAANAEFYFANRYVEAEELHKIVRSKSSKELADLEQEYRREIEKLGERSKARGIGLNRSGAAVSPEGQTSMIYLRLIEVARWRSEELDKSPAASKEVRTHSL